MFLLQYSSSPQGRIYHIKLSFVGLIIYPSLRFSHIRTDHIVTKTAGEQGKDNGRKIALPQLVISVILVLVVMLYFQFNTTNSHM